MKNLFILSFNSMNSVGPSLFIGNISPSFSGSNIPAPILVIFKNIEKILYIIKLKFDVDRVDSTGLKLRNKTNQVDFYFGFHFAALPS